MDTLDDFELLRAWRAGDTNAGDRLVARHFDRLYRFFSGYPEDIVADLVQRTWTACVQKRDHMAGGVRFRAFLLGVAHKEQLMYLRKLHRERRALHRASVEEAPPTTPSALVAEREQQLLLRWALRRISEDARVVLELFYWQELSVDEVAAILGLRAPAVKTRLHRARAQLRDVMAKAGVSMATLEPNDAHSRFRSGPRRPTWLALAAIAFVALLDVSACNGGGGGLDDDGETSGPTAGTASTAGGSDTAGASTNTQGGSDTSDGDTLGSDGSSDDGPTLPPDGGSIDGITLEFERSTPEQIGIYAVVDGDIAADARIAVRYTVAGADDWHVGHPLLRIHPEWIAGGAPEPVVDAFAGTIFDLVPGTEYTIELTLTADGQDDQTLWTTVATRALPPMAPAVTQTVTPDDDLQAAFDALGPGDVLELADGVYDVSDLHLAVSGSETEPYYIRGASRDGVVIRDPAGTVLQIQEASHFVIENLTLEGSNADSGTDASSVGVSFWNGGATQENVTLRGLDVRGVDKGIIASGTIRGVLVYELDLRGNNTWDQPSIESNATWNDDAVRLPGEGNCAFQNTLHGFGDSFAVTDGVHSAGVYFYRNRITMTGDDAFEADYGTRNLAFYDNYITNSATLLSLDPLWGGPLYCFRNVAINTIRGPFKLNDTNSGFMIYANTIVRTDGTTGWGWVQFNNGALRSWSFRNNLLVYRGGGNLLAVESDGNDPVDFTHNAWYPDASIWWTNSGGSFGSLAEARDGLPATTPLFGDSTARHDADVLTVADPFVDAVPLGADHLAEVTTQVVPALAEGDVAKAAGAEIPNITDGFVGAAPDVGAIIDGRPVPSWGAP